MMIGASSGGFAIVTDRTEAELLDIAFKPEGYDMRGLFAVDDETMLSLHTGGYNVFAIHTTVTDHDGVRFGSLFEGQRARAIVLHDHSQEVCSWQQYLMRIAARLINARAEPAYLAFNDGRDVCMVSDGDNVWLNDRNIRAAAYIQPRLEVPYTYTSIAAQDLSHH